MILRFQIRREDILEFTRQYHLASPTYRRTRMKVRWMLPILMTVMWALTTLRFDLSWTSIAMFFGVGLLWFLLYPARYDRNVQKYCEKSIDEGSYHKSFGECELTMSEAGLHSIAPSGESRFPWASVDRAVLTDTYLLIFLNGSTGYPIRIADPGKEAALAAYDYVKQHLGSKGEQVTGGNGESQR